MTTNDTDNARDLAIQQLNAKQGFSVQFMVYLLVNALLILIWAATRNAI